MAVNVIGNDGSLYAVAELDVRNFVSNAGLAKNAMSGITGEMNRSAAASNNLLKQTTSLIAAYASFQSATNFISDVVRVRGEFQQLNVALETMLGSKERADKMQAEIVDLAARTPLSLQDLTKGSKQLLAYGIEAEKVVDTLKRLGDVAAGGGGDITRLINAFGQVQAKGRLQAQELLQFTENGVPLLDALSKNMGKAKSEMLKLIEQGKVGFPEVQKAIESLTNAGGKFNNLMAKQAGTLTGQLDKLKDAWERMLNDIGRSNEGLFSDAIEGATKLVQNYQDVIDVLKVLTIAYGSYRTALIASAASAKIAERAQLQMALAGKEISAFQALQAARIVTLQQAWNALGVTIARILPTLATTAVLAAVGTALYSLTQTTSDAAFVENAMNDVRAESTKRIGEEATQLELLQKTVQNETMSREQRLNVVKKIRDALGDSVKSLSDEQILMGKAKGAIDSHIKDLERWATAEAALSKITELRNQKIGLENQGIDAVSGLERLGESLKSFVGAGDFSKVSWFDQMLFGSKLDEAIVNKKVNQVGSAIDRIQQKYGKDIEELLSKGFKSSSGNTTPDPTIEADAKALQKQNRLLEQKKDIIEAIQDLQRDAVQTGMLKEQSEIDKTREKYDQLFNSIVEHNKKVDEFNKKNPKTPAQKIGQVDIDALAAARDLKISNQLQKQEAENFKQSLDDKKDLFEQYEQAKIEIGNRAAAKLFQAETKGFNTYKEFLENQRRELEAKVFTGVATTAERQEFDDVNKAILQANKDEEKAIHDRYITVLAETVTFKQKEQQINEKYDQKEKDLEQNKGQEGFEERRKLLKDAREKELKDLQIYIRQQSALFKKLNENIAGYTKDQLKSHLKDLEGSLIDSTIPPDQLADLKAKIKFIKELLAEYSDAGQRAMKSIEFAQHLSEASNAFTQLGETLRAVNEDLGNAVSAIGEVTSAMSSAFNAMASFDKAKAAFDVGDMAAGVQSTLSGVGSVIQIISSIVSTIAANKQSEREARQAVLDFQTMVIAGELEYNALIRERQREQVKLNKTKRQGLEDEKKLLEDQNRQNKKNFDDLLAQIQKESFVTGRKAKKGSLFGQILGGSLDLFGAQKTKVKEELEALTGKTFDDLEKLFSQGQLTGKAKELFTQLQKINEEIANTEIAIQENERQTRELFAGTTAESITDTIAQGFRDGKRSVIDFAHDMEDIIRGAMLNALKMQALEQPIKKLFEQFADDAKDDGGLDKEEIATFNQNFNKTLDDANKMLEQIELATGISLTKASDALNNQNSLAGSIRAQLTEQTGSVIAGQFGGLRLTAIEQLKTATRSLDVLNSINSYVANLLTIHKNIQSLVDNGIKVK